MDKISRKEALSLGLKAYYTGVPCKHGHTSERQVSSRVCLECQKSRTKSWKKSNRQKQKDYWQKYYLEHREGLIDSSKSWRSENLKRRKEYDRQYKKTNRQKVNHHNSLRRAARINRTPKWLTNEDLKKIEAAYLVSEYLERLTGRPYHVDHIAPLQGRFVSGLHVPSNLRVISAKENLSKGNKYEIN